MPKFRVRFEAIVDDADAAKLLAEGLAHEVKRIPRYISAWSYSTRRLKEHMNGLKIMLQMHAVETYFDEHPADDTFKE